MPPTDTLEAPAAADEAIDMMALAQAADAAPEANPTTPEQSGAAAPATAPQDKSGQPAAKGKEAKPADATAPAAANAGEGKKETTFEKARSEAARRDRSWKALEEEKAQVRAEKARSEAELQTMRRELAQRTAQPAGPKKDAHGATAEDYKALAKRYSAEGNDELAAAAQERAAKLEQPSAGAAPQGSPTFETPEFQTAWQGHVQQLIAKEPDLGNPENPLVKAANGILADPTYGRFFKSHPDGIVAAVEVARLLQANAQGQATQQKLSTTEAALKTAKEENQRLNGLLQPRGSLPTGQPGRERKIEDMPAAEAAEAIHAMARAADRGELT